MKEKSKTRDTDSLAMETDGRAQRTIRSRRKIIEAAFALYTEGTLVPTAQEVADRSGMGIRTVFRHFSEMETLYVESDRLLYERYAAIPVVQPAGELSERIEQLVCDRNNVFAEYAPYIRATLVQKWRYKQLRKQYCKFCQNLHSQMLRFLPELNETPNATLEAADTFLSFENWDRQRTVKGKSKRAIQQIMLDNMKSLLL